MKKTISILFSILALHTGVAQTPNWIWAKSGHGPGHDYPLSISTDANGNSHVTGYFQPPMCIFGTDTLYATASANSNFFVAKYDSAGNCLWARAASGNANSYGTGIKEDANGNCVAVGYYFSSVPVTFGSITLSAPSGTIVEAFIVKYDPSGNVVWAQNAGATSWNGTDNFGVGTDAAGNIYMTGTFDNFIYEKKYDPSGGFAWQKVFGGTLVNTHSWSISTDAAGNSYVAGYFGGSVLIFDGLMISNPGAGLVIFIVKTDSAGNVAWAKSDGTYPSLYKPFISTDGMGNCYVTGYFNGTSAMFGSTVLTNAGVNDIFVVKYDASGNIAWAKRAGGTNFDNGYGIRADANGNSYVTGMFRGLAYFDSFFLFNSGDPEIFVAKYDNAGNVLWAKQAGGADVDAGNGIGIDALGNSYVTGNFFSPYIYFDSMWLMNSNTSFNPSEVFVAKLGNTGPTGMAENNPGEQVNIFPNPFTSETTLSFSTELKDAAIIISDVLGKEIRTVRFTGRRFTIYKNELDPGIYFVSVRTGKEFFTGKIVIQ